MGRSKTPQSEKQKLKITDFNFLDKNDGG